MSTTSRQMRAATFGRRRVFALVAGAILLATACAAPPPRPPEAGHAHGHDHAQGPLVHRFEHAEQWAPEFDDPARDAWQRPKDVVDAMEIQPGMTVADIGAGTGYFEPWLSRAAGATGSVLALDVEPDMVRYLNERAARERLTNVRPALVPMDDPKLPVAGVDRVLIVDTWHHIPDREGYAAKLRSGLKVGGMAFVVDFKLDAKHGPPPQHRLAAEQVARELAAGGLLARVAATSLPEQYIVVGARP
jgi:SAM-dependent methyltransferase